MGVFTGAGSAREQRKGEGFRPSSSRGQALCGNSGGGWEVRGCLKTGSHKGCPYG